MDRSDAVEALTAAAMRRAGLVIDSWDEPFEGFYIDPDIIAHRSKTSPIVVLVNASDSFFASQKKIWRNIEEPFEARNVLGVKAVCVSISFISPTALNALFYVSDQLFDFSYLLCERVTHWKPLFAELEKFSNKNGASDKRQLVTFLLESTDLTRAIDETLESLVEFFSTKFAPDDDLSTLWDIDRTRVKDVRANPSGIQYSSGSYIRKGIVRAALLGEDNLETWEAAGLGSKPMIEFKNREAIDSSILVGAEALAIHGMAEVRPGLGGRLRVTNVQKEIVDAIGNLGAQRVSDAIRALLRNHPPLKNYVEGARNRIQASALASYFNDHAIHSEQAFSEALFQCSSDPSYGDIESERNWILDISLLASGLSQTFVQRHCGIGRLTHVATGELKVTEAQADAIASIVFRKLPKAFDIDKVANELLRQRLYNLETHSYGNPLYAEVSDILTQLSDDKSRFHVTGYPNTNSAVVKSWHTREGSNAGQIKVQFLIESQNSGRRMAIRVGSCHDGNVGNKRKEVAAKGRILSYRRDKEGFHSNDNLCRVLILDGEWEGPLSDPEKHIRMMHEAGWQYILSPDKLNLLAGIWAEFFEG